MTTTMTTNSDSATAWMNRRLQKRYDLDLQMLSKHPEDQQTSRPTLTKIECSPEPVSLDDSRASSVANDHNSAADFSPQSAANSVFSMSTVDSVISVPVSPMIEPKQSILRRAPSFLSRSLSRSASRSTARSASLSRQVAPFSPAQNRSRSRSQSNTRPKRSFVLERTTEQDQARPQTAATPTQAKLKKRQLPPPTLTRTQSQSQSQSQSQHPRRTTSQSQHPRRTTSQSQHPPRSTSQPNHPPRTSSSQPRPPPPTPALIPSPEDNSSADPHHNHQPTSMPAPRPTTAGSTSTTATNNTDAASITIGLDVVALMRVQIAANQAQIRANSARMAQLRYADDKFRAEIQARLTAVTGINAQLSSLRAAYAEL